MSKIGKAPIAIPAGVTVTHTQGLVHVKGPKGSLEYQTLPEVSVAIEGNVLTVSLLDQEKANIWGLTRTLIANMIEGVVTPYSKKLFVLGVGFGAKTQGKKLVLSIGLSHPVEFLLPTLVEATLEKDSKGNDIITLTSIHKQLLGQTAASLRALKKPEPYKGKGIRYSDEIIKLKAGKAAKK